MRELPDKDSETAGTGAGVPAPEVGVYGIGVAVELSGVPEQSLRLFERKGLLTPARTAGGTRRYSRADVTRVRYVATLLEEGLNLAGIAAVLDLQAANRDLRAQIGSLQAAADERNRCA